ncbi:MAG: hypothetical protein K2H40_03660 [Lachnospiraceae bacterium]|nr:hypothetical protein [Lachnospiraceae bacterium]
MNLQRIKRILKNIFFLSPIPTLLLSVPAYLFVIYALAGENVNPAIAYVSYLLSAYALTITVTGIVRIVRLGRRGIGEKPLVKKVLGISLVDRYLKEDTFRAEAALYQGFFINFLYAGIKLFSGIRYKSVWFVTLAVYYILLAAVRLSLLHHVRKEERPDRNKISEWRRYRLCGISLLFMNVVLAGIIVLVVHQNSGFEYPGVLIYVMAMYTFYATIIAVWNVIKFRKYGSPVLSAAKVINLTAALVSMLSLETAMLTQFGTVDDADFRQIMTASTGAGVSIIVLGMAVYMIIHATRRVKRERRSGS